MGLCVLKMKLQWQTMQTTDQAVPLEADWIGSKLFAQACLSPNLEVYLFYRRDVHRETGTVPAKDHKVWLHTKIDDSKDGKNTPRKIQDNNCLKCKAKNIYI